MGDESDIEQRFENRCKEAIQEWLDEHGVTDDFKLWADGFIEAKGVGNSFLWESEVRIRDAKYDLNELRERHQRAGHKLNVLESECARLKATNENLQQQIRELHFKQGVLPFVPLIQGFVREMQETNPLVGKIQLIKSARSISGLGLRETKEAVDGVWKQEVFDNALALDNQKRKDAEEVQQNFVHIKTFVRCLQEAGMTKGRVKNFLTTTHRMSDERANALLSEFSWN